MSNSKNKQSSPVDVSGNAQEFVVALQSFLDAVGGIDLPKLNSDVQSLTFDNERIVKPALLNIQEKLNSDTYATNTYVKTLEKKIEDLTEELRLTNERTRNYAIVEKVVFGLVGVVLLAVIGALVGLVVIGRGAVK